MQRDVGDVSGPDLIPSRDQLEVHKAGISLRWFTRHRGAVLLVDRP